jgi:hypothetical protein
MAQAITLAAPAAQGLFCASSHEPFHADGGQESTTVTERSGQKPPQRRRNLLWSDRTVEQVVELPNRAILGSSGATARRRARPRLPRACGTYGADPARRPGPPSQHPLTSPAQPSPGDTACEAWARLPRRISVPVTAAASMAALRAVARDRLRRPLTRRPLPGDSAPIEEDGRSPGSALQVARGTARLLVEQPFPQDLVPPRPSGEDTRTQDPARQEPVVAEHML